MAKNNDYSYGILKTAECERFYKLSSDPKVITDEDIFRVAAKLSHKRYGSLVKNAKQAYETFDIDDLFQGAVLNLREKKGMFDPSKSVKSTFLYTFTNLYFKNCITSFKMPKRGGEKCSLDFEFSSGEEDAATLHDFIPDANPTPDERLETKDTKEKVREALEKAMARTSDKKYHPHIRAYVKHFAENGFSYDNDGTRTGDIMTKFVEEFNTTRSNFNMKIRKVYGEMKKILKEQHISI